MRPYAMHPFPEIDFALPGTPSGGNPLCSLSEDEWGRYSLAKSVGPADASAPPGEQAFSAFENLEKELAAAGMAFGDVVRTWIYADRILEWYGELNLARDRFFRSRGVDFIPASTGIGWTCGSGARVVMGAFAARAKRPDSLEREILPSPLQCPAMSYGSRFSRAVELRTPAWKKVVVSGTAAMERQSRDAAHAGDPEAQIACAMEAVEAIYASRGISWSSVTGALAYLKDESYRGAWEAWLAAHPQFPRAHSRAIVADVCRDEWLFEIESDATVQT